MSKFTEGPWKFNDYISVVSEKHKICDVRGWGYLTGKGAHALGLSDDEAVKIQESNAHLISAAPDMYDTLRYCLDCLGDEFALPSEVVLQAEQALKKADGNQ